jgi:hypothetical protein
MIMQSSSIFEEIRQPDETLLWEGAPQQGLILRRSDILFFPLALCLSLLAVAWEGFALVGLVKGLGVGDLPVWMPASLIVLLLLGLPFFLLAVFLLAGRFYYDRQRRRCTHYLLSNQRIVIVSGMFKKRNRRSIPLTAIKHLSLHPHAGQRASIHFSPDTWLWWIMLGPVWWFPLWVDVEAYQPPVFERIEEGETVFQLIKQAQADHFNSPL